MVNACTLSLNSTVCVLSNCGIKPPALYWICLLYTSPVIEMGEPRKPKIPVNNFAFFEDEFRERLQTLLEEIFSEEEPDVYKRQVLYFHSASYAH